MRARQALAIALATFVAVPLPALADGASGLLSGIVKAVSGSTLANVDIEFVNLASGVARTMRTDGAGALRGILEDGSYSVEARGYSIVSGPRTVSFKEGEVTHVDLTLGGQDPAALPAGGSASSAGAGGGRTGNIVALALFSGALTGAAIRAATVKQQPPSTRLPPSTSPSR